MSHTRLLVHVVFATHNREPEFTDADARDQLFAYTGGIARNVGCRWVLVGGWVDHLHLLLDLPATRALSDVVRDIKANSSRWYRETSGRRAFAWQAGYGASASASRSRRRSRTTSDASPSITDGGRSMTNTVSFSMSMASTKCRYMMTPEPAPAG